MYIDTHAHLYLDTFKNDVEDVIQRAKDHSISKILLPNIDSKSIDAMLSLSSSYPEYLYPMAGIHPNSVTSDFKHELDTFNHEIVTNAEKYIAIGEIGIDLYRNKTYLNEQKEVFRQQISIAIKRNLPIVIHTRESFTETLEVLDEFSDKDIKGVFHCFSGNKNDAQAAVQRGFKLGIGGVVTFTNSNLGKILQAVSLKDIVLETDAPFLAPVPHRGKRNECSYIPLIAKKLADIYQTTVIKVGEETSKNAHEIFRLH